MRLLRLRHEALDEREFQSEMIDIFVGLRDLHTNYILPTIYHRRYAYLPFRVEEFYAPPMASGNTSSPGSRRCNGDAKLVPGRGGDAWERHANRPRGLCATPRTKAAATWKRARAQGLDALTLRWFGMSTAPG